MKLISKSILYYLILSIPLLVMASLFSYYLIKGELHDGTDEILEREKHSAERFIKSSPNLKSNFLFLDSLFTIKQVPFHKNGNLFSDSIIFDKIEAEFINYRVSKSYYNYHNTTYNITILKPTLEENELMEGLIFSLFLVIAFLILSFLFVNWILSKWLWKPFYNTISALTDYELNKNRSLRITPSTIKEFNELNDALVKMTGKIYSDFLRQKEFTENASHEIQTPLSVIKSKIELLIQSENLKESEMQQVQAIETAANKLSSLNKALLLLVKIENHQFKEIKELNIKNTIEKVLLYYKDLIVDKNIQVTTVYKSDLWFKIDNELCEIFLTNLLQNAIRHNFKNGFIKIELNNNTLSISNTGLALKIKQDELFERFKKDSELHESLGIGLAIVKSIATNYHLEITYSYTNDTHSFCVIFL